MRFLFWYISTNKENFMINSHNEFILRSLESKIEKLEIDLNFYRKGFFRLKSRNYRARKLISYWSLCLQLGKKININIGKIEDILDGNKKKNGKN